MEKSDARIDLYEEWTDTAWKPVVMNEFIGFLRGSDDDLRDDCAAILGRLKRLSEGGYDPAPDARKPVPGLNETLYGYPCGGLVALYAIDGAEGRVKRVVTVLRVAKALSAQPGVKDLKLAEARLKHWRRGGSETYG